MNYKLFWDLLVCSRSSCCRTQWASVWWGWPGFVCCCKMWWILLLATFVGHNAAHWAFCHTCAQLSFSDLVGGSPDHVDIFPDLRCGLWLFEDGVAGCWQGKCLVGITLQHIFHCLPWILLHLQQNTFINEQRNFSQESINIVEVNYETTILKDNFESL